MAAKLIVMAGSYLEFSAFCIENLLPRSAVVFAGSRERVIGLRGLPFVVIGSPRRNHFWRGGRFAIEMQIGNHYQIDVSKIKEVL